MTSETDRFPPGPARIYPQVRLQKYTEPGISDVDSLLGSGRTIEDQKEIEHSEDRIRMDDLIVPSRPGRFS